MVSLSSPSTSQSGAVFLDLPNLMGNRIGTYLMNEIVLWVKHWPDAKVRSISLLDLQAQPDNKERRNRFYEQFGLNFKYTDKDHKEGTSMEILAKELKTTEKWKENITERELPDFLSQMINKIEKLSKELERITTELNQFKSENEKAKKYPVLWAIKQLYYRYAPVIGLIVIVILAAIAGVLIWLNHK